MRPRANLEHLANDRPGIEIAELDRGTIDGLSVGAPISPGFRLRFDAKRVEIAQSICGRGSQQRRVD